VLEDGPAGIEDRPQVEIAAVDASSGLLRMLNLTLSSETSEMSPDWRP